MVTLAAMKRDKRKHQTGEGSEPGDPTFMNSAPVWGLGWGLAFLTATMAPMLLPYV